MSQGYFVPTRPSDYVTNARRSQNNYRPIRGDFLVDSLRTTRRLGRFDYVGFYLDLMGCCSVRPSNLESKAFEARSVTNGDNKTQISKGPGEERTRYLSHEPVYIEFDEF